ncbi:MAG: GAF domain-containing protein [Acidobacteriota bacterium]
MEKEREVRLRRRIEEMVRARVGSLEQDISKLQREVNESFNRLLEQTDVVAAMPGEDEAFTQIAAEVTAQVDQAGAESVRLGADIALLRDSVTELDEQRTQADVLNALVARAANFAPRVVLFVVKSGNAVAWAARGLDDGAGNNSVRGMSIPLQSDTVLRVALNSQQTFYGSPDLHSENQVLFGRLGTIHPQRVLTVPLKVRGKTAALVYADSADRGEVSTNVEAIELLAHTAGLVVELVSLRARMSEGTQAPKQQTPAPPAAEPAATSATVRSGALPETPRASSDLTPQPGPSGDLQPPAAPTYFRPTVEPAVSAVQSAASEPSASGALGEEEKAHNDARRFARLLVSEIKLYNEQKVAEGRRGGDLYDRLKEDIDRSRQMYEKRVTPSVAAKFDYFYDELVSTLAEGDPSKLGSDSPGPTVSART